MQYLGGKTRISNRIKPYLVEGWGSTYRYYIEPFVGGCGMFKNIPTYKGCTMIGYDKNEFLIKLLNYGKVAVNGEYEDVSKLDPTILNDGGKVMNTFITGDEYRLFRELSRSDMDYTAELGVTKEQLGLAGFLYSYRGDFFQGYTGNDVASMKAMESYLRTIRKLVGKHLMHVDDYADIWLPDEPAIIYVDPPYKGERYVGLGYKAGWLQLMDYDRLYDTLRHWRSLGHAVYMSEREAPDDFIPIWSTDVTISMAHGADWKRPAPKKKSNRKPEILFTLP